MATHIPIDVEFADLFTGREAALREVVVQALAIQRLNGMHLTRDIVADAIAYAAGELSETDYHRRAARRAAARE